GAHGMAKAMPFRCIFMASRVSQSDMNDCFVLNPASKKSGFFAALRMTCFGNLAKKRKPSRPYVCGVFDGHE
ncbi:MAG: hypothetical protein ACRD18_14340, partial [Terriglobia bacterium]